jgi:hypothetical protein
MLAGVRQQILQTYLVLACEAARPVALMVGRIERAAVDATIGYLRLCRLPLLQLVVVRDGCLGHWSHDVTAAIFAHLQAELARGVVDRALICKLPVAGPAHLHLRQHHGWWQRDLSCACGEHWRAHLPDDFETFMHRRNGKHRSRLRSMVRHFQAQYGAHADIRRLESPEDIHELCLAAERVACATYLRGLGAGFVDNAENRQRLALAARKRWLRAWVLYVHEQPVAFWAGECIDQVMYPAWTAFDPAYQKNEVGTLLFLRMVQDLTASGVRTIDFGPGGAQYKERYADECLLEQDVALYALRPKAQLVRVVTATINNCNRLGKWILDRLDITGRFKRMWRDRLAAKVMPGRRFEAGTSRCK